MWRLRRAERAKFGVLAGRLLEVEKQRAVRLQESCEVDDFEQLMVGEASITDEAGYREATAQLAEIESTEEEDLPTLGRAMTKDATGARTIELALRYRTATERSLFRMLRELRDLQTARTRS